MLERVGESIRGAARLITALTEYLGSTAAIFLLEGVLSAVGSTHGRSSPRAGQVDGVPERP